VSYLENNPCQDKVSPDMDVSCGYSHLFLGEPILDFNLLNKIVEQIA
jgi:hypothetical protein